MSDEGKKFSMIDLGSIAPPIAEVVCKLLSQLESAVGYILPDKSVKDAEKAAHAYLIEEISKDERFNPYERGVMVSSYKKYVKEHRNQTEILSKAVHFIKENASPETVEEDWFSLFMDKARLISNEDLQLIWARILAQEVNEPSSVSRQLLLTLFQMRKEEADIFMQLIPYCVDLYENGSEENHAVFPIIAKIGPKSESLLGIGYGAITVLESYNLIRSNDSGSFGFSGEDIIIKYNGKTILSFSGKQNVVLGCMFFTNLGRELLQISERTYSKDAEKYIVETLEMENSFKSNLDRMQKENQ